MVKRRQVLGMVGAAAGAGALPGTLPSAAAAPGDRGRGRRRPLRVLQFNIWQGGANVAGGWDGIVDTIAAVRPDVATLSESSPEWVAQLRSDLARHGLTYYDNQTPDDNAVISRHPIVEHASYPSWSKAVIDLGGIELAAYSGHLEYRYYVNYLPRGYGGGVPEPLETSEYGWDEIPTGPITDVALITRLNRASGRTAVSRTVIEDALQETERGRLAVLAGDFNEASHLDWGRRTRHLFDHHGTVVKWSTTTAFEQAGFTDSYRERHPDPVLTPGFTWPSDNPGAEVDQLTWAPKADERDRIDYIFYRQDRRLRLQDSVIVGPSRTIVRSKRRRERSLDPFWEPTWTWPTDHKAVLSTFRVTGRR